MQYEDMDEITKTSANELVVCTVREDISVINAQAVSHLYTLVPLKNIAILSKLSLLKLMCCNTELGLKADCHGLCLSDNIKTFLVTACT
jgi:hypothetical protein